MKKPYLFYANLKGIPESYVEANVSVQGNVSDETIDSELKKWVKTQLEIDFKLVSVDALGNHAFDYNVILNQKKHKGVYSVFCEEGESEAEIIFKNEVKDYLLRDVVQFDKDELFDEED